MQSREAHKDLVLQAIRKGAQGCAERLTRICRAEWRAEVLLAGAESDEHFDALLSDVKEAHFGSLFSVPGGVFLLIFDRRSGLWVYTRFMGDFSDKVDLPEERLEPTALSEVSNIIVNAAIRDLAALCRRALILSAPEQRFDAPRDLLSRALKKIDPPEKLGETHHIRLLCPALSAKAVLALFLGEDLLVGAPEAR
jgi:hypothetical protein